MRFHLRGKFQFLPVSKRLSATEGLALLPFWIQLNGWETAIRLLRDIACLARAHSAFVVLSAPNVTHRDIGAKLAFGRWDYTKSGMSGHTSARLFDQKLFALTLERTGLHTIARNDIVQSKSDQHFPPDHPALASGTPLHGLLVSSADLVDPNSRVSKFIWACAPALEVDREISGSSARRKITPVPDCGD